MLNLPLIDTNCAVALDQVAWLAGVETRVRQARASAPWHLWIDKYSHAFATKLDHAASYWRDELESAKNGAEERREKECKENIRSLPSGKSGALSRAVELCNAARRSQLRDACHGFDDLCLLLRKQHGLHYRERWLLNSSRLLLHLGRASALENVGLYSDRTTGLPVIPGPSLKGAASSWSCLEENFNTTDGAFREGKDFKRDRSDFATNPVRLARRILGCNAETGSQQTGEIIFLGGFPLEPPALELDIVTPHPRNGLGDPTPNPFLAVAPNTYWRFVLLARPHLTAADAKDLLDQTERWIVEALGQAGVGAKTAAGYGRFRELNAGENRKVQDELERREKAELSRREQILQAKKKAELRTLLSPADREYESYVASIQDWTGPARELATKSKDEKEWILRFFRSGAGQETLKTWTNPKGKQRIQNLREAGL